VNEDWLFQEEDPPNMYRFVRQVGRPCLVFKVLGAYRKCQTQEAVRAALQEAYANIKPTDAIIVGMWHKHMNQAQVNADHVRRILASL
jgi:hypothetical protein